MLCDLLDVPLELFLIEQGPAKRAHPVGIDGPQRMRPGVLDDLTNPDAHRGHILQRAPTHRQHPCVVGIE